MARDKNIDQRVADGIRDLESAASRREQQRRANMTRAEKAAEEAYYERIVAEQGDT